MERFLSGLMRWLIVIAMPVFLVLTCAHLVVARWYPHYEYAKADFPPDRYGFTQAQRLELAQVAIDYLNTPGTAEQAIGMLTAQRLPGGGAPLYAPAEISHMLDVKRVMDRLWRVEWAAGIVIVLGLVVLVARRTTRAGGYWALMASGLFTALVLAGLAVFVLVGWNTFFIQFHALFFAAGTWTFDWSDSLIRLFPDKFWFDAGAIIVLGTLAAGLAVALVGGILWRSSRGGPVQAVTRPVRE